MNLELVLVVLAVVAAVAYIYTIISTPGARDGDDPG
jgi:hypothetical protein